MNFSKIIALCIITGITVYALLLYTRPLGDHKQDNSYKTLPLAQGNTPHTLLFFSPATTTLSAGQTKTITVMVDTGGNDISAAQLELRYDPTKITISSTQPGGFFTSPVLPVNTNDRGRGRIDYVITLPESQPPKTGQGKLALLTVSRNPLASQSATTQIDFLPKTAVRGSEQSVSLLKNTQGATIILDALPQQNQP